jgi:pyrroline-5-carboxylate reductase
MLRAATARVSRGGSAALERQLASRHLGGGRRAASRVFPGVAVRCRHREIAVVARASSSTPPPPLALGTVGFIGAGSMAEAMARGFAESGAVSPSSMRVSRSSDAARAARWTNLGVEALASNGDVARVSDVVVLAVKPHVLPGVLTEIASHVSPETLLLSVAAGVSTSFIERAVSDARGGGGSRDDDRRVRSGYTGPRTTTFAW